MHRDVGGYVYIPAQRATAVRGRLARALERLADGDGPCWVDGGERVSRDVAVGAVGGSDVGRVRCHVAGIESTLVALPVESGYATFGFFVSEASYFDPENQTRLDALVERWASWCEAESAEFAYVGRFANQVTMEYRDEVETLIASLEIDELLERAFLVAFLSAALAALWTRRVEPEVATRPSGALIVRA
jgi:hypothetical protein